MATLQDYLTSTRRLLHDSQASYWQDPELTEYINSASRKTAVEGGAIRVLQPFTLTANQDTYDFAVLGIPRIYDVVGLTLLWGQLRVYLQQLAWSELQMCYRAWLNYATVPAAFARYGPSVVMIGPKPSIAYQTEWDTTCFPQQLVNPTDDDGLPYPFTECVPFYASHLAKIEIQAYDEAQRFLQLYSQRLLEALQSRQRLLPQPYGSLNYGPRG